MAYFERLTVYALAAVLQVTARCADLVTVWLLTSYGVKQIEQEPAAVVLMVEPGEKAA